MSTDSSYPLSRSEEHSTLCPRCRSGSGNLILLTSLICYLSCDACGHRWQSPVTFDAEGRPRMQLVSSEPVSRPAACPECGSKAVGTLAKTITPDTAWRCQGCGHVWKVARRAVASR